MIPFTTSDILSLLSCFRCWGPPPLPATLSVLGPDNFLLGSQHLIPGNAAASFAFTNIGSAVAPTPAAWGPSSATQALSTSLAIQPL